MLVSPRADLSVQICFALFLRSLSCTARGALSRFFLWLLAAAAKKSDGVKDFVASLGAKRACKYVESVNALCETLRAEKDGTKALQKRLLAVSGNATSAYGGGGVDG